MSSAPGSSSADLRALFINCTLKRSPELSHTQGLIDISAAVMKKQGADAGERFDFAPARPSGGG